MKRQYQVLAMTNNNVTTFWIDSEVDLIAYFKDARIQGDKFLSWKYGCLSMDHVVGIYRHPDMDEFKEDAKS